MSDKKYVNYEDFGAVGDGVTDDFDAIEAAHNYANANGLEVKTKSDATYYVGEKLTREMKDAARTLEFEKAAYLRDEIKKLREG